MLKHLCHRIVPLPLLTAMAMPVLPATAQTAAPPPAPSAGKSVHFDAVAGIVPPGGDFYSYINLDGDISRMGKLLNKFMGLGLARQEVPASLLPLLDSGKMISALGLDRIKAVALSSQNTSGNLIHNRALLYMPEGRHGLFRLAGGEAGPFKAPGFAPADSDLVVETELTLSVLAGVARDVVGVLGIPQLNEKFEISLGTPVPGLDMTVADLISRLDFRVIAAVKLDPDKSFPASGQPLVLPAFHGIICLEGLGFLFPMLRDQVSASPEAVIEKGEGFELIRPATALPGEMAYFQPVLYHDTASGRILASTNLQMIKDCLAGKNPLSGNPAFARAMEHLPQQGNELSYATPAFFAALRNLFQQALREGQKNSQSSTLHEERITAVIMAVMDEINPPADQPLASVRANLPEGILAASNATSGYKTFLTAWPVAVMSLLTAGAMESYSKIKGRLDEKAAQKKGGSRQSSLEEEEEDEEMEDNAPENTPGNGEPEEAAAKSVGANLQQLAFAADTWFLENPAATEVTYEQLVSAEMIFRLKPVSGESYQGLRLKKDGGTLTVRLQDGTSVSRSYGKGQSAE